MDKNEFLEIYDLEPQDLKDLGINWVDLYNILQDYKKSIDIGPSISIVIDWSRKNLCV